MKLVEIQENQFNGLISSEPNKSFYQTSNWGNFYTRLDYSPYYLGYVDKNGVYGAYGLFLVKNGSLFSKREAICPFGFLINYYDTNLLKEFTNDVKKFLSKKGASSLIINPNVNYLTARGNNDLLIKNITNLGYEKTNNNFIYVNKIEELEKVKATEDICLKTYIVTDNTEKLFKANANYKYLFETMSSLAKFIVCELDVKQTLSNLKDSIAKANAYIEMHAEDFKYFKKIDNKKKDIADKQNYINLINKNTNENDDSLIIAVTCLIEYDNKVTQLFVDNKKDFEVFNTLDVLKFETLRTISKLGYESFDSYVKNDNSSKTELIGEFTYHIK